MSSPSSRHFTLRLPVDVFQLLKRAGARQTRDLTKQVIHYCREGLARDGLLVVGEVPDGG